MAAAGGGRAWDRMAGKKAAYVYYISAIQVNIPTPPDALTGQERVWFRRYQSAD